MELLACLCLALGMSAKIVSGVNCDFHSIFQTPVDYHHLDNRGILERSSFPAEERLEGGVAAVKGEAPHAYANAQINLRFGEEGLHHPDCVAHRANFGMRKAFLEEPHANSLDAHRAQAANALPALDLKLVTSLIEKLKGLSLEKANATTNESLAGNGTGFGEPIKVDGFDVVAVNASNGDGNSELLVTYPIDNAIKQNPSVKPQGGKKAFASDVDALQAVKGYATFALPCKHQPYGRAFDSAAMLEAYGRYLRNFGHYQPYVLMQRCQPSGYAKYVEPERYG